MRNILFLSNADHVYPFSMVTLFRWILYFHGYIFQLLWNTIARFVRQLVILLGKSDGVERGRGCEAAGRAGVGSPCESCRNSPSITSLHIIACSFDFWLFHREVFLTVTISKKKRGRQAVENNAFTSLLYSSVSGVWAPPPPQREQVEGAEGRLSERLRCNLR